MGDFRDDFLTDDDIIATPPEDDEEDKGFYGTGLVVGEDGAMLLVIANGGTQDFSAFRMNDVEASSLALMIQAVLS